MFLVLLRASLAAPVLLGTHCGGDHRLVEVDEDLQADAPLGGEAAQVELQELQLPELVGQLLLPLPQPLLPLGQLGLLRLGPVQARACEHAQERAPRALVVALAEQLLQHLVAPQNNLIRIVAVTSADRCTGFSFAILAGLGFGLSFRLVGHLRELRHPLCLSTSCLLFGFAIVVLVTFGLVAASIIARVPHRGTNAGYCLVGGEIAQLSPGHARDLLHQTSAVREELSRHSGHRRKSLLPLLLHFSTPLRGSVRGGLGWETRHDGENLVDLRPQRIAVFLVVRVQQHERQGEQQTAEGVALPHRHAAL
mmetsp:Transcript_88094/g.229744  ORF Transcript_88094/g.229744 Transcript_88094/m.229744 type:complete len:309 (-) Transcript_88094:711-1637(-)